MEVKEAIEFIERYRYARNSKTDEIIDLLKSLEAENKILKKENMAYKGLWEEIGIVPIKLANDFQEIEQKYLKERSKND